MPDYGGPSPLSPQRPHRAGHSTALANLTSRPAFLLLGLMDGTDIHPLLVLLFLGVYLVNALGNLSMVVLVRSDAALRSPMYYFLKHLSLLEEGPGEGGRSQQGIWKVWLGSTWTQEATRHEGTKFSPPHPGKPSSMLSGRVQSRRHLGAGVAAQPLTGCPPPAARGPSRMGARQPQEERTF